MTHVYKIAILMVLFVGCSTPNKQASLNPDFKLPDVSWTEGETSTHLAPEQGEFKVQFETTAGNFVMLVHRDWAPRGAERFYQLIQNKYYDGAPFYRVMPGFMVQFGMCGDPKGTKYWDKSFPDEDVKQSNLPGLVSYAKAGPNTRSTQLFINYGNNKMLDSQGFSPFAEVVEGMQSVIEINSEYQEQPSQRDLARSGNKYVFEKFPNIDYIVKAAIIDDAAAPTGSETKTPEVK